MYQTVLQPCRKGSCVYRVAQSSWNVSGVMGTGVRRQDEERKTAGVLR